MGNQCGANFTVTATDSRECPPPCPRCTALWPAKCAAAAAAAAATAAASTLWWTSGDRPLCSPFKGRCIHNHYTAALLPAARRRLLDTASSAPTSGPTLPCLLGGSVTTADEIGAYFVCVAGPSGAGKITFEAACTRASEQCGQFSVLLLLL